MSGDEQVRGRSLRLWLAKLLLPRGYAIWTYGLYGDGGLDESVVVKEPRGGGS